MDLLGLQANSLKVTRTPRECPSPIHTTHQECNPDSMIIPPRLLISLFITEFGLWLCARERGQGIKISHRWPGGETNTTTCAAWKALVAVYPADLSAFVRCSLLPPSLFVPAPGHRQVLTTGRRRDKYICIYISLALLLGLTYSHLAVQARGARR